MADIIDEMETIKHVYAPGVEPRENIKEVGFSFFNKFITADALQDLALAVIAVVSLLFALKWIVKSQERAMRANPRNVITPEERNKALRKLRKERQAQQ